MSDTTDIQLLLSGKALVKQQDHLFRDKFVQQLSIIHKSCTNASELIVSSGLHLFHNRKLCLFSNGILQFYKGSGFKESGGEVNISECDTIYWSDQTGPIYKQNNNKLIVIAKSSMVYGWKIKFKASSHEKTVQWIKNFVKFAEKNLDENQVSQLYKHMEPQAISKSNISKLIQFVLSFDRAEFCNGKLPNHTSLCKLQSKIDEIIEKLRYNKESDDQTDNDNIQHSTLKEMTKFGKCTRKFIVDYLERYIQLFRTTDIDTQATNVSNNENDSLDADDTPSMIDDMTVLKTMLSLLENAIEVEQMSQSKSTKNKNNRDSASIDIAIMNELEKYINESTAKSINKFTQKFDDLQLSGM